MYLDETLEFADATSVAAAASTALIGDVVDLSATPGDLGIGEPMWLVIRGTTAIITAGTAGTIQFFLCSDSLATLGAGVVADCTTHLTSAVFVTDDAALNDINIGTDVIVAQLPSGTYERYLGILCTVGTTEVTAGAVDAFLTHDISAWTALPDAT